VGCSGPSGVCAGLGAPQNPRTSPGDTPAEGRALGRAAKLLKGFRGKSQPFLCYFFHTTFLLEMYFWLASGRRGVCGGSGAWLGGSGQEFGAGAPAASAFLALPALPSPGLRAAGSRTSPRRLGHWPLFRRIKLALLLSLSLFQQFLPPLSLGSGETFLPGGCQEKYAPEGHAGTGTGRTMVAGMAVGPRLPGDEHRTPAAGWCLFSIPQQPLPSSGHSSHQRDGWLAVPWVTKEPLEDAGTRRLTSGVSQR